MFRGAEYDHRAWWDSRAIALQVLSCPFWLHSCARAAMCMVTFMVRTNSLVVYAVPGITFQVIRCCKWPTMKVGSYNMSLQVAFGCGHHTCPMLWEIHSCDVLVNDRVFSLCCWIDHCRVQQVCYKMSHPLSQAWGCYWGAFSVTGNSCPLLRTPIHLWDVVRY